MKVINLEEKHSALQHYMAQLRDVEVHDSRMQFRNNLRRIGSVMAYEVSKTFSYEEKNITTPLGVKPTLLYRNEVVIGTVLRAGLALHDGFLSVLDGAEAAFVAAYREENGAAPTIHLDYMASPQLDGKTLLIVDPMLATGGSLEAAYKAFLRNGTPAQLHLCVVIAAPEGIEYLQKLFPGDNVTLWTAAIDERLNENAYIVPGLGDAGDLSFGVKL